MKVVEGNFNKEEDSTDFAAELQAAAEAAIESVGPEFNTQAQYLLLVETPSGMDMFSNTELTESHMMLGIATDVVQDAYIKVKKELLKEGK